MKPPTAQNFVRLSLAGRCKSRAIGRKDGLPALPWERSLLPEGCAEADCGIPATLFGPWVLVRESCSESIRTADSVECMYEVIRNKSRMLGLMDDSWVLEEKALAALLAGFGRDRPFGENSERLLSPQMLMRIRAMVLDGCRLGPIFLDIQSSSVARELSVREGGATHMHTNLTIWFSGFVNRSRRVRHNTCFT